MAAAIDLTTLGAVETFLGLPSGNDDEALLSSLITAASQFIATYCSRIFQVASYTENRNGTGSRILPLQQTPIAAVASVTVDTQAIPASGGVGAPGYLFDTDRLYLRGYEFRRGIQNIAVAYSAGYATIPADLAQAAIEVTTLRYKEIGHFDLISKAQGGEITAFTVRALKPSTQTVLDFYRRKIASP